MNKYLIKRSKVPYLVFSLLIAAVVISGFRSFAATTVTHTFKINISGAGTIKNVNGGTLGSLISCVSTSPTTANKCIRSYTYSTTPISYQAYPSNGYRVGYWEATPSVRAGADYSNNPFNVSRTVSWTFTHNFVKTTTHTFSVSGSGVIKGLGVGCPSDCNQTFDSTTGTRTYTATPSTGNKFNGWDTNSDGKIDSTSSSLALAQNTNKTAKAFFAAIPAQTPAPVPVAPKPAPTTVKKTTPTTSRTTAPTVTAPAALATPDTEAPSVPSGLKGSLDGATSQVVLSWDVATDNIGVTGYDVERTEKGFEGWQNLVNTEKNQFEDFTFSNEKIYLYRVKSHDGAGNSSAFSEPVEVSTGKFSPNVTTKEGGRVSDANQMIIVEFQGRSIDEDLFVAIETVDKTFQIDAKEKIVGSVYEIKAKNAKGEEITTFKNQLNLAMFFTKKEARGVKLDSLSIVRAEGDILEKMPSSYDEKSLGVSTLTDRFSYFFLAGEKTSIWVTIFKIFIIITLIAVIGFGGYYGYTYFRNSRYQKEHQDDFIYRH